MKAHIQNTKKYLGQPWIWAILFVVCIPAFSEFVCPIFAGAALLLAYFDAKNRHAPLSVGILGKLILLYILYMALGLFYTKHILSTLSSVMMWAIMFMAYLAMTTVLIDRRRLNVALFIISLVAGVVGFIGCVQYVARAFLHWNVSLQFWSFFDELMFRWFPIKMLPWTTDLRISSTFNNPNILAEYLVMVIPLIAYYAFNGCRTGARTVSRLCLLLAAIGITFTFSRGSYIAILAIALVFFILNIRKIMLYIMSLVAILLLIPEKVISRLFSVTTHDASVCERLGIWNIGVKTIKQHPLFGIGAGISNTWELLVQNGINAPHMHNIILQLMAEGGAVALLIMIAIGCKILHTGFLLLRQSSESRMIGVALIAFVVGFCIDGMADFPLLTPKLVGMFLMVIAFSDIVAKLYLDRKLRPIKSVLSFKFISKFRSHAIGTHI